MTFFKPLQPLTTCGNNCLCCMSIFLMIFCIVTFTSTFYLVGFWDCPANSNYYYIQLAQLCYDNSGTANDDFTSCDAWTTLADNSSGAESADATAYHNGHGLAVTAFIFAFFCNVSLLGGIYLFSDPDVKNKTRYLTALLGAIAGFFLFVVIAQDTSTWYTNASNYYFDTICSSNMVVPSSGWVACFVGMVMSVAFAIGILFPYCGCAAPDETLQTNLMDPNSNSTYPQQASTGMQSGVPVNSVVYVVQTPGPSVPVQAQAQPYEAKTMP